MKRALLICGAVLAPRLRPRLALCRAGIAASRRVSTARVRPDRRARARPAVARAACGAGRPRRGTSRASGPAAAGVGRRRGPLGDPAVQFPLDRRDREDVARRDRRTARPQAHVRHSARRAPRPVADRGDVERRRRFCRPLARRPARRAGPGRAPAAPSTNWFRAGAISCCAARWSSRLDAPQGMDPVEFAALRAQVLNTMGEGYPARALVQDVDSSNYNARAHQRRVRRLYRRPATSPACARSRCSRATSARTASGS